MESRNGEKNIKKFSKHSKCKNTYVKYEPIFTTLNAQTPESCQICNINLTFVTPLLPKNKKGNLLAAFLSILFY